MTMGTDTLIPTSLFTSFGGSAHLEPPNEGAVLPPTVSQKHQCLPRPHGLEKASPSVERFDNGDGRGGAVPHYSHFRRKLTEPNALILNLLANKSG